MFHAALLCPRCGPVMTFTSSTSSQSRITLVAPSISLSFKEEPAKETLVFDELPAPLERVLLSEEGTAAGSGWANAAEEDACALLGAAGLDEGEQLSLTLCDDMTIQELNGQWRGKDAATDVLSFPMDDPQLLGDLVISLDTTERQAKERGHSIRDELRVSSSPPCPVLLSHSRRVSRVPGGCAQILMVHGVLHLLGYDHETSQEEHIEMAEAELKLLTRLGWRGQGLIEGAETLGA